LPLQEQSQFRTVAPDHALGVDPRAAGAGQDEREARRGVVRAHDPAVGADPDRVAQPRAGDGVRADDVGGDPAAALGAPPDVPAGPVLGDAREDAGDLGTTEAGHLDLIAVVHSFLPEPGHVGSNSLS
jgi:hypothetical protein